MSIVRATEKWPSCEPNQHSVSCDKAGFDNFKCSTWKDSGSSWLKMAPWGFRYTLRWIAQEYNNPEIFVTENGFSTRDTESDPMVDSDRIEYYQKYMNQMLRAIQEDGVKVIGYAAWSLMDNFEWNRGFAERFGLFYVNHSIVGDRPETLDRVAKSSVAVVSDIFKNRGWPDSTTEKPSSASTSTGSDELTTVTKMDTTESASGAWVLKMTSFAVLCLVLK